MANEPLPRFMSSFNSLGGPTDAASKILGLKLPKVKKLTPDQQSKLDADIKAKDERVRWIEDAEKNTGSIPSQYLKKGISNTASFLGGLTGLSDFTPQGRTQSDVSNAAGQLAGSGLPLGAAAKGAGAALTLAGMPFASYKKILPFGQIFHGSPLARQIDKFNPLKKKTGDVLGFLQHGAENPRYSAGYAHGLEKHSEFRGNTENAAILPLELEAKNILDLVDPTADDMAAAIQSFGKSPGSQATRRGLIKDWKTARRNMRVDPNTAVEKAVIDPRHHTEVTRSPSGSPLMSNETEMFKNLPAITVAEKLRMTPEDFARTQFDAIRYNDMQHKSFAWPDSTPIKSPLGHDYTPDPLPINPNDVRFISGSEGVEDIYGNGNVAGYGVKPSLPPTIKGTIGQPEDLLSDQEFTKKLINDENAGFMPKPAGSAQSLTPPTNPGASLSYKADPSQIKTHSNPQVEALQNQIVMDVGHLPETQMSDYLNAKIDAGKITQDDYYDIWDKYTNNPKYPHKTQSAYSTLGGPTPDTDPNVLAYQKAGQEYVQPNDDNLLETNDYDYLEEPDFEKGVFNPEGGLENYLNKKLDLYTGKATNGKPLSLKGVEEDIADIVSEGNITKVEGENLLKDFKNSQSGSSDTTSALKNKIKNQSPTAQKEILDVWNEHGLDMTDINDINAAYPDKISKSNMLYFKDKIEDKPDFSKTYKPKKSADPGETEADIAYKNSPQSKLKPLYDDTDLFDEFDKNIKKLPVDDAHEYIEKLNKNYQITGSQKTKLDNMVSDYAASGSIYPEPKLAVEKPKWKHHWKDDYSASEEQFKELQWLDRAKPEIDYAPHAVNPTWVQPNNPLRPKFSQEDLDEFGSYGIFPDTTYSDAKAALTDKIGLGELSANEVNDILSKWPEHAKSKPNFGNSVLTKHGATVQKPSTYDNLSKYDADGQLKPWMGNPTEPGMLNETKINQFIKDATMEFDNLPNLKGAINDSIDAGVLNQTDAEKIIKQWKKSKQSKPPEAKAYQSWDKPGSVAGTTPMPTEPPSKPTSAWAKQSKKWSNEPQPGDLNYVNDPSVDPVTNQFVLSKKHAIDPDDWGPDADDPIWKTFQKGPGEAYGPEKTTDELFENFANNASGDSAASIEALERMKAMAAKGESFVVKKGGVTKTIIGPEAVDYVPQPGEVYGILDKSGNFTKLQSGGSINSKSKSNIGPFKTETIKSKQKSKGIDW